MKTPVSLSPPHPHLPPLSLCEFAWSHGTPVGELQVLEKFGRDEVQESASSPSFLTSLCWPEVGGDSLFNCDWIDLVCASDTHEEPEAGTLIRLMSTETLAPSQNSESRFMCASASGEQVRNTGQRQNVDLCSWPDNPYRTLQNLNLHFNQSRCKAPFFKFYFYQLH